MRELYDENGAILTFCWGGTKPDCVEGSVECRQSLAALSSSSFIEIPTQAGENGPVTSLRWNNYQEAPDGCGQQVTTGIAVFEFNDGDKVIRHYSVCVGQ
jgi:hypothetical protein